MEFRFEINFHQQDEVSIYIESDVSNSEQQYSEILLLAAFTNRQLVNLAGHPSADSLASLLAMLNPVNIQALTIEETGDVKLVEYQGSPGRKQFIGNLNKRDEYFDFKCKAKGFGLLARGIGYYAPTAVKMLFAYFIKKRASDSLYLKQICTLANFCGTSYKNGELKLENQHEAALFFANIAVGEASAEAEVSKVVNSDDELSRIFTNYQLLRTDVEKYLSAEVIQYAQKACKALPSLIQVTYSGYLLRKAEEIDANKTGNKPGNEILNIIESSLLKIDKLQEIAKIFNQHFYLGLGEPIKPYVVCDFDVIKKLFDIIMNDWISLANKNMGFDQSLIVELINSNMAWGYYIATGEYLIERNKE